MDKREEEIIFNYTVRAHEFCLRYGFNLISDGNDYFIEGIKPNDPPCFTTLMEVVAFFRGYEMCKETK